MSGTEHVAGSARHGAGSGSPRRRWDGEDILEAVQSGYPDAPSGELTVLARPHRVRWVVIPVAVAFLALFSVVGALLKNSSTGVHFETSSQASMIALGVLLAGGTLMLLRPRVRASVRGIEIRNVFWTKTFDWSQTYGVSFPDGARWAHLELPYDEYVPIMAIQSLDGARAVTAMRELRRYQRALPEDEAGEAT